MSETAPVREEKSVVVEAMDLWAIQKAVKFNTFMIDPRQMKPMFPDTADATRGGVVQVHTAWKLRRKVNALLGRFVAEGLKYAQLPLDYDECWYIDNVISIDAYKGAQVFLLQVFQVIWEHENYIALKTGEMNQGTTGPDGKFDVNSLVEYLAQAEDKSGWFPGSEEPPKQEV